MYCYRGHYVGSLEDATHYATEKFTDMAKF